MIAIHLLVVVTQSKPVRFQLGEVELFHLYFQAAKAAFSSIIQRIASKSEKLGMKYFSPRLR